MMKSSFKKHPPVCPEHQRRRNRAGPGGINVINPVIGPVIFEHNYVLLKLPFLDKRFKFTKIIFLKVKAYQDQSKGLVPVH